MVVVIYINGNRSDTSFISLVLKFAVLFSCDCMHVQMSLKPTYKFLLYVAFKASVVAIPMHTGEHTNVRTQQLTCIVNLCCSSSSMPFTDACSSCSSCNLYMIVYNKCEMHVHIIDNNISE